MEIVIRGFEAKSTTTINLYDVKKQEVVARSLGALGVKGSYSISFPYSNPGSYPFVQPMKNKINLVEKRSPHND